MPKAKAKPKATNKRRRYTESDKETAIELYMTLGNYTAVSEKLSIPVTTIKQWCYGLKKEDPDGYDDLRRKNMEKFAEEISEDSRFRKSDYVLMDLDFEARKCSVICFKQVYKE